MKRIELRKDTLTWPRVGRCSFTLISSIVQVMEDPTARGQRQENGVYIHFPLPVSSLLGKKNISHSSKLLVSVQRGSRVH